MVEKRIGGWEKLGREKMQENGSLSGLLDWVRKPNMSRGGR